MCAVLTSSSVQHALCRCRSSSPNWATSSVRTTHYDVMAPGLDFAFGFTDESYINKAKERGWLLCDESMTSPALFAKTQEFSAEVQLEPIRGLKITLTGNRTDSRTTQLQFMFDDMSAVYSGSYTKTHIAIATALRGVSIDDGYHSDAFDKFLENIPVVAQRIESQYYGKSYPSAGFIGGTIYANRRVQPENGSSVKPRSSMCSYRHSWPLTRARTQKITPSILPGFKEVLPNWRVPTTDSPRCLSSSAISRASRSIMPISAPIRWVPIQATATG